jgi:hypothetical protein
MGVPVPEMNAAADSAEEASVEAFVSTLRTISASERRKHASVYNYWLSIRRNGELPPIHDLDPLEISDAGPFSLLLEMIGGGEDAEIRHLGQAIGGGLHVDKIGEAANPSLLSCIARHLPVVAACRDAFAFEDSFETAGEKTRCWVTLLPFSATGTWIDFVYGFVSLDGAGAAAEIAEAEDDEEAPGAVSVEAEPAEVAEAAPEQVDELQAVEETAESAVEPDCEIADPEIAEEAPEQAPDAEAGKASGKGGFSAKFFETLANVGGFYGRPVGVELDLETASLQSWEGDEAASAAEEALPEDPAPVAEAAGAEEPAPVAEAAEAEEPAPIAEAADAEEPAAVAEAAVEPEAAPAKEPVSPTRSSAKLEGTLQSKLTEVRTKADEARQAKLRANAALYEGLSAAYDFALEAEESPEEYLQLVQAEGLKVQLRSPMKPVAKLAFDGMCDEATIKQLEAVLAWAFDEELPRGSLAGRIEEAGGIGAIIHGMAKAA